ncbi:MAG TPA: tetratricopeptide repeat protein, partial [Kofleriaceae bacterium]|nr:tetratricopeptide repeat protein [Kofleriaceae bacterium]
FWLVVVLLLVPSLAHAGYTHYWTWHGAPDSTALHETLAEIQQLVTARTSLVTSTSGESEIVIVGRDGVETFVFPGDVNIGASNFCKTGRKPYDEVVTAALLVARAHFPPSVLEIASDGGIVEWRPGRLLYSKVFQQTPPMPFFDDDPAPEGVRFEPGWTWWYRPIVGILVIAVLLYLVVGSRGSGWGSYYLIWLIVPMAISIATSYPLLLGLVVVGFVARRWLPDPWLSAKYARRVRSLDAQIRANPSNITARHDIAVILLDKRRPRRALQHVEVARKRDPNDIELEFVEGSCRLAMREYEAARAILLEVATREPKFRYGDAQLRAADAMIGLRAWDDAITTLRSFVKINTSSVEGWFKLSRALAHKGDVDESRQARTAARALYHELPPYQRRRQRVWYMRALVAR